MKPFNLEESPWKNLPLNKQELLWDLVQVLDKHKAGIWGCGCCGSPSLVLYAEKTSIDIGDLPVIGIEDTNTRYDNLPPQHHS